MDITITITDEEFIAVLEDVSKSNNMTIEQYATGIVESWIKRHLRNLYIGHARNAPLSELKSKIGDYPSIKKISNNIARR